MSLSKRLAEYVRACFTGIWIQSFEHDDAMQEIERLCRENYWLLTTWDVDKGSRIAGGGGEHPATPGVVDPVGAIHALSSLARPEGTAILVLRNFHKFLGSADILQALENQLSMGKQNRTFVFVLSALVNIPIELEKQFVVIEHDLPDSDQLSSIARSIATEEGELPSQEEFSAVIDAASGLTRFEAEGAFSLSLVRHSSLKADVLWEIKSQTFKKTGLLSLHRGGETFAALGGLEALKSFCSRALRRVRRGSTRPRGVLLLGVPGTGKSAFAKALGNETGRPTLVLDIGALMGSLVGATEANVRQALKTIDAMAPAILFVDEIEKALAGVQASGQTDSGVSARLFGSLLTWMNDHTSDVFFVATSNDVAKLPPEFSRAERFDGIFFCDLPGSREKEAIWRLYLERYKLAGDQKRPSDANWTGAEIKSCCRLADLLETSLVDASRNIVPVAVTAGESIESLRNWASGRCLSADRPEIYSRDAGSPLKGGRNVRRDPSNN